MEYFFLVPITRVRKPAEEIVHPPQNSGAMAPKEKKIICRFPANLYSLSHNIPGGRGLFFNRRFIPRHA